MIPTTIEELDQVKKECTKLVNKRASASGLVAVIPVPGLDVGADVGIMMELTSKINKKFGLSSDQIDELDTETKRILMMIISSLGAELAGKLITKELVVQLLKKVGVKVATKASVKFVPIIGQAAAAGISFGAMKLLGRSHVEECYKICKKYIEDQQQEQVSEFETVSSK